MKMKIALMLASALFLAGCDNASKIDGSSMESFRYSSAKVLDQLTPEKQEEMKQALVDTISYYDTEALLTHDTNYDSNKMRLLIVDGKTADEIIAEGAKSRAKKQKLIDEQLKK